MSKRKRRKMASDWTIRWSSTTTGHPVSIERGRDLPPLSSAHIRTLKKVRLLEASRRRLRAALRDWVCRPLVDDILGDDSAALRKGRKGGGR